MSAPSFRAVCLRSFLRRTGGMGAACSSSSPLTQFRPGNNIAAKSLLVRSFGAKAKKKTQAPEISYLEPVDEALKLVKCFANATYDETIEVVVRTGLDPRKPNQSLRGVAQLPHGSGKKVVVAVFAKGDLAEEAKAAGADIVGAEDLAAQIQGGEVSFNVCIASPDMMGVVGRVARILGPKGMMPNPKVGTVTKDVAKAVADSKKGQVQYKCDKSGTVLSPIGKASFTHQQLAENFEALVSSVIENKPTGSKGTYIKACHMSSSQGKGVPVEVRKYPFRGQRPENWPLAAAEATQATTSS